MEKIDKYEVVQNFLQAVGRRESRKSAGSCI